MNQSVKEVLLNRAWKSKIYSEAYREIQTLENRIKVLEEENKKLKEEKYKQQNSYDNLVSMFLAA